MNTRSIARWRGLPPLEIERRQLLRLLVLLMVVVLLRVLAGERTDFGIILWLLQTSNPPIDRIAMVVPRCYW